MVIPDSPVNAAEFERLAYETAVRTLEHQERLAEEVRGRTGLLLTAASLAASFLGREALAGEPKRGLAVLAFGAFLTAVSASVYVLLPRVGAITFSPGAIRLYEGLRADRHDLVTVYRTLIYDLGDLWAANDRVSRRLFAALRIGILALTVEIVVLAAMAGDSLY